MPRHTRAFHLHVHQRDDRPGVIRWSATRTLWTTASQSRSGTLGSGEVAVEVEGGTTHEVAIAVLTIALEELRRQVRDAPQV